MPGGVRVVTRLPPSFGVRNGSVLAKSFRGVFYFMLDVFSYAMDAETCGLEPGGFHVPTRLGVAVAVEVLGYR